MFNDKARLTNINRIKVPKLHGHVKIKTYYPLSGNIAQIEEGDNIVTNAVRDIFSNNWLGCVNYPQFFPLWSSWYGGVLCYESPHPTVEGNLDPNDYFPQADSDNHLTAHAGQTVIDTTHDDDPTRGNPVASSYTATEDSIKQVFEWGTTHGNGTISALSLTHADTGSFGLGNTGYHFANSFYPLVDMKTAALPTTVTGSTTDTNNLVAQLDDTHGLGFHIGGEDDYYATHTCFETDQLTVFIRKLPYLKTGIFDGVNAIKTVPMSSTSMEKKFTVYLSFNLYCQPSYYFDYETKYLWIFSNITGIETTGSGRHATTLYSNTEVNYAVIDCGLTDGTPAGTVIEEGTIESDTENLAPTSLAGNRYSNAYDGLYIRLVKDGNYIYLPTTGGDISWGQYNYEPKIDINGYKKINIASQADQAQIEFNTNKTMYHSSIKGGGIIIESTRVCNGNVGYTCKSTLPVGADTAIMDNRTWCFQSPDKVSSLVLPISYDVDSTQNRYILANKMVNTTKYNLSSAIQKTASQAMTVEYTLQEVEPEEEEE